MDLNGKLMMIDTAMIGKMDGELRLTALHGDIINKMDEF